MPSAHELESPEKVLRQALGNGDTVLCVHYACRSFTEAAKEPVAVTAFALAEVGGSGTERTYSIDNSLPSNDVVEREKDLLQRAYRDLETHPNAYLAHWNMNSTSFSFEAIAARYRYLFGTDAPYTVPADRLFDLDEIVARRFGADYAPHPKLRQLANLNAFFMPNFKQGREEAEAAEAENFGLIGRSTGEKAHLLKGILVRLLAGTLKTRDSVGAVAFAGERVDAVAIVLRLSERFLLVQRALKRRHGGRTTLEVKDEYDAQDLMRALLVVFFEDVRDEEWIPSYAGAASRIDFVLAEFGLAIELKHTRETLKAKELGEQLVIDVARYRGHPHVRHLVCVVFDHDGHINQPRGIERDLKAEPREGMAVTVLILDR